MEWNFKNGVPIYSQIVDELTLRIASHGYEPGDKLPSVRDLAMEAGVNPNTMQRALSELERRGLVYTERTSGRFVTKDKDVLRGLNANLAARYIEELVDRLEKLGMERAEIAGAIGRWLDDNRQAAD